MSRERKVARGESVDDWMDRQPKAELLRALRALVFEVAPHLTEQVKWSNPWYSANDNVVYLASHDAYATFGVCKGAYLHDEHRLLEGTGKAMRHVKVRDLHGPLRGQLRDLLAEAVAFDQGDASA